MIPAATQTISLADTMAPCSVSQPKAKLLRWLALTTMVFLMTCYHPPSIRHIPAKSAKMPRTLFIALDGISYEVMKELQDEGHFAQFNKAIPFISTFPSDTTVGFTGILQPLGVGKVPGYEVRFYSFKENKIKGGTPFDFYKIHIRYKDYFDSFRHQMHEKAIMYMFPGLAGKQDLVNTEQALLNTDKKIIMTYIGGTDGAAHLLGRKRTKNFLKFMDEYLKRMIVRYRETRNEPLRVILYSDHGFHYTSLKSVSFAELKKKLRKKGFRLNSRLENDRDIVTVPYGLLSAGIFYTKPQHRAALAKVLGDVGGVDLVFWHNENKKEIFMLRKDGELAKFEYKSPTLCRYVGLKGDPLNYNDMLDKYDFKKNAWLPEKTWFEMTWKHDYPDAGFRLYDAFFNLVENSASIMISTKKNYQYGSVAARLGTIAKLGHKGTHGGLFREPSWGVIMTNDLPSPHHPTALRYDELFRFTLPESIRTRKNLHKHEVSFILAE